MGDLLSPQGGGSGAGAARWDKIISFSFVLGNFGQSNDVNFGGVGLGQNTLVICDVTGQRSGTITGFQGGADGKTLALLRNDSDLTLGFTLPGQSASSSAANRTMLANVSGSVTWYPQQIIEYVWLAAVNRWVLIQRLNP